MLTKEEVLQAVARGWCHENNANKEMDHDLAIAIAEEVIALRGMGGEAVAWAICLEEEVVDAFAKRALAEEEFNRRNEKWPDETRNIRPLYTAPAAAPANEALAKRLLNMSRLHDSLDMRSSASLMREAAAALGGGE